MEITLYAVAAGAGALAVFSFVLSQRRERDVRRLAERLNFAYLGRALPGSIVLTGTELSGLTEVWNVIDGKSRQIRIIAFDCRIGTGKASWRRTVIAAQGEVTFSGIAGYGLQVESTKGWSLAYQPKELSLFPKSLMSVPELEAHLSSLG